MPPVLQISRLALLSLLAVFKDIIPGYRIRLPSAEELKIKVSAPSSSRAVNCYLMGNCSGLIAGVSGLAHC